MKKDYSIMLTTGVVGAFYTFTSYKVVKSYGLGFGLRHNDHVLIGILCIIVAGVLVYKHFSFLSLRWRKR